MTALAPTAAAPCERIRRMLVAVSLSATSGHPLNFLSVSSAAWSLSSVLGCACSARRRAELSHAVENDTIAKTSSRSASSAPMLSE